MYNYVVTAHKPSAVHLSLTANFTGPKDKNLIVTKSNRLVIYLLTPDCLQPILDTSVYGRIACIEVIRSPGADRDSLCLLTERLKFCVLDYDSGSGELLTKALGDVTDAVGRMIDSGPIMHIDPDRRLIGLHLYDGFFKVIPVDSKGHLKDAFNIRLEELQVLDIQFLHGFQNPTIVILYQDPKEMRHVKTYEISIKDKDLLSGPWHQTAVEHRRQEIAVPQRAEQVIDPFQAHQQQRPRYHLRADVISPVQAVGSGVWDLGGWVGV